MLKTGTNYKTKKMSNLKLVFEGEGVDIGGGVRGCFEQFEVCRFGF